MTPEELKALHAKANAAKEKKLEASSKSPAKGKTVIGRTATGEAIYEYDSSRAKPPYEIGKAFDKAGIDRLNMARQEYGLDPIEYGDPSSEAYKKKVKEAAGEMQQAAIGQNPELVYDYMLTKNPKPNAKLEQLLTSKGYGKSNADVKKAITEGKLTADEIRNAYKDDQWWFRAVTTQKKQLPRAEYEKKMKQEGLIKQGDKSFFAEDPTQPWLYTEYEPFDPDKKLPPAAKKEAAPAERKPFERNPPLNLGEKIYAPWWLQDIVKVSGAAADLARVKPYYPWQATPQVRLPDATFYDPTRELAANTEQANLASQFHQAFTGPKTGAISGVQGQAMKNAADIMAKYNNMNVQIANQLSQERTGIMNQASQNKANLDTQLFDKYTIANQQFDNAKNMARQNLRQSYIDAITNRAKTQALNTLYPNYYTNPITGGFVNFKPGYDKIKPTQPGGDELTQIQKIIEKFPGTSFKDAMSYVKGQKMNPEEEEDKQAYLRAQGHPGF